MSPDTFLELNKAPTVNFWEATPLHCFEELNFSCPKSFSKVG